MRVREARPEDAEAMSAVLVASITELCCDDHGGRPEALAEWTADKTPEDMRRWLAKASDRLFVAEEGDGEIVGVGGFNAGGEVTLNYVAPSARFRGVSRAMLATLEDRMRASGITEARLDSTTTARRFYLESGWREGEGASARFCNVRCRTMTKRLD
ncbi:MAG: GNAT family N-acetyltransferase [Bauldia sp.]|nr:GNAT family N-acetyltransferase [Bauldia sp.]